jgi:hypothetical protein
VKCARLDQRVFHQRLVCAIVDFNCVMVEKLVEQHRVDGVIALHPVMRLDVFRKCHVNLCLRENHNFPTIPTRIDVCGLLGFPERLSLDRQ